MAEHLRFADQSLFHFLAVFVNLCLYHDIMPSKCVETIIIPVLKCSNVQSLNNYHFIAITNVISKMFEHYVLSHVKNYLSTNDNQFGYKSKIGTDLCVFLSKQAVSWYVIHKSPVYSAFIDSSKAYDRVKVRLDWTRSNVKRRLATFVNLREWSLTSLAKVANLRNWLLIFATCRFMG